MNLRISNLSYQRNIDITATDSANLFDGTALSTTTDATFSLIPKAGCKIEGTLHLSANDLLFTLATDLEAGNVIVSQRAKPSLVVQLDQNIVIEWDGNMAHISAY